MLVDSILEAILTVSPNKQYRGLIKKLNRKRDFGLSINRKIIYIFKPTTPATTGPLWHPKKE